MALYKVYVSLLKRIHFWIALYMKIFKNKSLNKNEKPTNRKNKKKDL